jgi:small subunit ribosomal protein S17
MAETIQNTQKQEKVGEVVSTKMKKTIVVEVTRRSSHPVYHRVVTRNKKFYAHDEQETAQVGDVVRIVETRPLSRLKRWRLAEIVRRSRIAGVADLPEAAVAALPAQEK